MEKQAKIYVAGHTGLVGGAIWRDLHNKGYANLVGRDIAELDLALSVLNSLRDVNLARLALLQEADKRSEEA